MPDRAADAARLRAVLAANPRDRVAWHNLASAEGDLGNADASEAAARQALGLGIRAAETRLVLGRALFAQRRFDEARVAYEEALRLRPDYVDAHRDLAQLVWMQTGDTARALGRLESQLRQSPRHAGLLLLRSILLEFAGDLEKALALADSALAQVPADQGLLRQAARLWARTGNTGRALSLARQAVALAPDHAGGRITLCEAALAAGLPEEAEAIAGDLYRADPSHQYALALLATAWRLRGDARYAGLYDYGNLVDVQQLDAPAGWPSLERFLDDLADELNALHSFHTHPLEQSVREGSQLPLLASELARPLIAALFQSISAAVGRYSQRLGTGRDPVRSRNTGGFRISGAWSIRLRSGGYHTDHVHQAWFSSACYIAVPTDLRGVDSAVDPNRAGWLRFGRPGIPTTPAIEADHFVPPQPGRLVLFPAYMWHGVEPFSSAGKRLTVAFDVVPG